MADEKAPEAEAPSGKRKLDLTTIVLLVNALATIAAAGAVLYTKVLYEKPKITETQELAKIKAHEPAEDEDRGADGPLVHIDAVRVNIASPDGGNHFAFFALSAECTSEEAQERFESRKDQLMDKLISLFNRKKASELNHVQGRLVMKEEVLREFNTILGEGSVKDVFFPSFMVQ
jgi:flagellar basal body-associated protein FliL